MENEELTPKDIETYLDQVCNELADELFKLQNKLYDEELNENYEDAAATFQLINLTITTATHIYCTFSDLKIEDIRYQFEKMNDNIKEFIRTHNGTY
jgi:hypothetical protein